MKKKECLRLLTSFSVGLFFLALMTLSHWSSTVKLLGMDGNYTGKKTLHLFRVRAAVFECGGACLGILFNFPK